MRSSPPFHDPVYQFINRHTEKRLIRDFYEGRAGSPKRCLLLRTSRDVGMTFFLRHLEQTADDRYLAVYADCGSSDPEVIFRKFFDRIEEKKVLRWRALSPVREVGDAALRLLSAVFLPAPLATTAGAFAATVTPRVATTAYASTPSERFGRLITSGRWRRPILFLVDNAQEIKPQSLNILNTVFSERYDHVRFVLSFVGDVDHDVKFEAFHRRLRGFGLGVETLEFPPPDERLVAAFALALHVSLAEEQCLKLLRATDGSISRIIGFLQGDGPGDTPPTELEREILRYLLVAAQPLRRDDVLALVLKSPRMVAPASEVGQALAALAAKRLIVVHSDWLGDEVEIAPGQARAARDAVPDFADLVAAQELYGFFSTVDEIRSPRHSQSAYGALLFRLAKQVDPGGVPKRAFELVRISLGQADLAAATHYIEQATGSRSTRSIPDLYTLLAFQVSVENYARALETLDELGADFWQRERTLRIIHAIVLNRVRAHGASDSEIDALLAEPGATPEEFALLTSYKVAGLLHEGELARAREVFERARPRIRAARNRGYALRNCAAVYFWGEGRDLERAAATLAEATHTFQAQQDAFGLYTTLNNQGALTGSGQLRAQGAAAALPAFEKAFDALAVFGTQHLEEVGANVGVALLVTRRLDRASAHLRKMSAITSFDFPRVVIESALAFAELLSGDVPAARERVRLLTERVAEVRLPEAVYRANVNAAAVEAAANAPQPRLDHYVRGARGAGFWAGTASLDRVLAGVREGAITPATLPEYLSYDYFQYWSQNPLTFLPPPLLPEQAVSNHVSQ